MKREFQMRAEKRITTLMTTDCTDSLLFFKIQIFTFLDNSSFFRLISDQTMNCRLIAIV